MKGRLHLAKLKMPIQYKLILLVYIVVIPIVIISSTYIYHQSANTTTKQMDDLYLSMVETLDKNISAMQNNTEDIITYLTVNSDVEHILGARKGSEEYENPLIWKQSGPANFVQDMVAIKPYIKAIVLYTENGIRPFIAVKDKAVLNQDLEEIHNTAEYKKAFDTNGENYWTRIDKSNNDFLMNAKEDSLMASKVLFSYTKFYTKGYLVVLLDEQQFLQPCQDNLQNDSESIYILNQNNEVIIHTGADNNVVLEKAVARNMIANQKKGYFKIDQQYVFFSKGKEHGSTVLHMIPEAHWNQQLRNAFLLPFIVTILFLVATYPISKLLTRSISRPLHSLYQSMMKFKAGDFNQQVEVVSEDEIGRVTEGYNTMVKEIEKLIDTNYVMVLREKESELNALQAQINPHFLYNTLDTLYWQALNIGSEDLAEDIMALSELFRLVLSSGEGVITVEKECKLVENYLHIQQMRFNKRLDYEINVSEEIKEYSILKLILQPFVENAIVHGLEGTSKKGVIYVNGALEDGALVFYIQDNGIGMSREQLAEVFEVETSKYSSQRVGKYAIKNIRERLRLKYGENYSLTIDSEENLGTMIRLQIPMIKEVQV